MNKRGFTLVELIVVIAIIALLATLAVVGFGKSKQRAKLSRVTAELSSIATSVTQYASDNNYQYPPDADRAVPPGLERYLTGGVWPTSAWPEGVFDWDNWQGAGGVQVYQVSYRLCDVDDPISYCSDQVLFPNFTRYSSIFYCMQGPCAPHRDHLTDPGYCINCKPKEVNY
jgi:prepilin-type N-terminal cleavage/methylation domain-containing protein